MTLDPHAEALAYLDQARAALTDRTLDERAAAIEARRATRIADRALAVLMDTSFWPTVWAVRRLG